LEKAGYEPLKILDFSYVGGIVMLVSIAFIVVIGRHLLPRGKSMSQLSRNRHKELTESYHLEERSFTLTIGDTSHFAGKTLAQSKLRPVFGINVLSLQRKAGSIVRNPGPETILKPGDQLFVQGRWEEISALKKWKVEKPGNQSVLCEKVLEMGGRFFRITIEPSSSWVGKPAEQLIKPSESGISILAIKRPEQSMTSDPRKVILAEGDQIILFEEPGVEKPLSEGQWADDQVSFQPVTQTHELECEDLIFILNVPQAATTIDDLPAINLLQSGFHFTVLGVEDRLGHITGLSKIKAIHEGDRLVVAGRKEDLVLLSEMEHATLKDDAPLDTDRLETEEVIMAEAVLAPRSMLAGKTVKEINFRKKYGVSVVALWREGKAVRTNLHLLPLRFGEALLLYGRKEKITMLGQDNDLILLTDTIQQTYRTGKALLSSLILAITLMMVMLGYLTLSISVILGVIAMVVTGCIKMEEAYRSIDWRSVFLIAGMLPLGVALEQTGAASLIAQQTESLLGASGPWFVLAGLYLLTLLANLAIHPAALVVIMAPVVIQTAESMGVSPHSFMIAIAIAASGSFISPVAHPSNLLVMGPGSYQFSDYLKIGIPFSLIIMVLVFLLLPVFWPF
ncbi:MAG: SLC13 family permease, partial [Bacteroidota bacterium]